MSPLPRVPSLHSSHRDFYRIVSHMTHKWQIIHHHANRHPILLMQPKLLSLHHRAWLGLLRLSLKFIAHTTLLALSLLQDGGLLFLGQYIFSDTSDTFPSAWKTSLSGFSYGHSGLRLNVPSAHGSLPITVSFLIPYMTLTILIIPAFHSCPAYRQIITMPVHVFP